MVASRKIYQPLDLKSNAIADAALSVTDSGDSGVGVFTDSRTTATGIEYAADYSANFTSRSLADKAYVDSVLAANDAMIFQGGLDASGVNQLPAGDAGDTYKITVAGDFNGTVSPTLEIGDTVYCTTDSTAANTPANWVFIQTNIDAASETVAGFIEIATQAETDAGTDDARAVTPAKLEGRVAAGSDVAAGTSGKLLEAGLVLDEDNMVSDSNQALATQQSIKAYVDSQVSGLTKFTSNALSIGPTANSGSPVTVNHALGSTNVTTEVFELTTITATTIAFVDSNPDTITDSGSGFGSFEAGQIIEVSGSTSNDGTYTIDSVVAGTITLVSGDALTVETAGASVTITAREVVQVDVKGVDSNNIALDSNTDITVDVTVIA